MKNKMIQNDDEDDDEGGKMKEGIGEKSKSRS